MWRRRRRRALRRGAWWMLVAIYLAALGGYLYVMVAVLGPAFRDLGEIP